MGVGLVILGCCRAVDTLLKSGGRRKRHTGSSRLRNEILFYALGDPSMGKLCGDWTRTGILYVPKNKKGLVSSILEPLIGEKLANGWLGKLVDILAVFATVAGVVTSLGLGTLQINAGFNRLFGLPTTLAVQIGIIVVVSILYIGSAVSGIDKGIKIISDTNLYVAVGLLVVCFLVGPKIEILDSFVNGMGAIYWKLCSGCACCQCIWG